MSRYRTAQAPHLASANGLSFIANCEAMTAIPPGVTQFPGLAGPVAPALQPGGSRTAFAPNRRARRAARRLKAATPTQAMLPISSEADQIPRTRSRPPLQRPRAVLPPPSFQPIAATTQLGAPSDLAMGWDGTLWAIDDTGTPHLYDPVQDAWEPYGEGIDAAAYADQATYIFRGPEMIIIPNGGPASAPQPIGTQFPNLPDSFKLGVTGAATAQDGTLYLFRGGWYVPADASKPKAKLTDLASWPQDPAWTDGIIDAVLPGSTNHEAVLARGGSAVTVDLIAGTVLAPPFPLIDFAPSYAANWPPGWAETGIDAALLSSQMLTLFRGPATATCASGGGQPYPGGLGGFCPGWPAAWNPVLAHAPTGRIGQLWAVTQDTNTIVAHDGQGWTVMPGGATSIAVGTDGAVFSIGSQQNTNTLYRWHNTDWRQVVTADATLAQVAVGDGLHVWVRDSEGRVSRLDGTSQSLTPYNAVGAAAHIAANPDGTLWHNRDQDAHAYRFVEESPETPSGALSLGSENVAVVHKVAGTGYGSAYLLTRQTDGNPGIYRYDSPYVFKSALPLGSYLNLGSLVQGGSALYYLTATFDGVGGYDYGVVALDQHTGAERQAQTPMFFQETQCTGLVFDPVNNLLYFGTAPYYQFGDQQYDNTTPGQIIAVDATTLAVRWTFTSPQLKGVDATPALSGTRLCFGDRTGTIYMVDTKAAAATGNPTPVWTWCPDIQQIDNWTRRVTTPLISVGTLYVGIWQISYGSNDPENNKLYVASCTVANGGDRADAEQVFYLDDDMNSDAFYTLGTAPLLGRVLANDGNGDLPALYLNGWKSLICYSLDPQRAPVATRFDLQGGARIISGLTYDDGSRAGGLPPGGLLTSGIRVWFGDDQGQLWSIGAALHPADSTPVQIKTNTAIYSKPVLYKDPKGGVTVLFGMTDNEDTLPPSLYAYDPSSGGPPVSIETGITGISTLSAQVSNGVIYAGGWYDYDVTAPIPTQIFALRVDTLPQTLRDFVVDGQMMQDPEDPGTPTASMDPTNPVPPSRARYQTHLTVVDDQRNPIPNEPLKIWADQPTTILVNNTSYPIGPGDADYASVIAGVDGTCIIRMGRAKPDRSDAPDMYTPALRVWASFMDPFERVVINPDHSFHLRTATAHANAGDDDPDKVNLVTASSYTATGGSKPLFSQDEVPTQPNNCANAIGQMRSGVGFGGGGASESATTLFGRLMQRTSGHKSAARAVRTGDLGASAGSKYMAYDEPGAAGYFPTNIPAPRPVNVAVPTGIIFSKSPGASSATLQITDHATAQDHLDRLPPPSTNPPWLPPGLNPGTAGVTVITLHRRVGENIFEAFWNWLRQVVTEITDLVVTIADEVMVGIQIVWQGVQHVFKAIIKVVDEIASAVGSFFKMIEKAIEDVIAALSVLFHFGEILWTHNWLKTELQKCITNVQTAVGTTIKDAVDAVFKQGETAIVALFANLRSQFSGQAQISNSPGMGSTRHSAFMAGPRGGAKSPHGVQCTWGTDKLQSGAPSATSASTLATRVGDPVSDFFAAFAARLTGDGDLSGSITQLKDDASRLFASGSAAQFFQTLVQTLLDLLETILVGAFAVANALVDGVLGIIDAAISAVMTALTTEIEIPVLTWLYQSITGDTLTILDLVTLVAAIPVTILCRVIEGAYPSSLFPQAAATTRVGAAPAIVQRYLGILAGMLSFAVGCLNATVDVTELDADNQPKDGGVPAIGNIAVGLSFLIAALGFPLMDNDDVSQWSWGAYGVDLAATLIGLASTSSSPIPPQVASVLTAAMNAALLAFVIVAFVEDDERDPATDIGFASSLAGCLPGMINPVKFGGEVGRLVVGAVDVAGGIVVGALTIADAMISTGDGFTVG